MTKNDLKFIEYVKAQCALHGIKCDLRNTKSVKLSGNIRCSGWFDSDGKELVVSMGREDGLHILVHEYGHLTQWLDSLDNKHELWDLSTDSLGKVDAWLGGKRVHHIARHLGVARDLELDNEKRSVKLIKKWNLSIDTKEYIKRANAYVQFYNWMYFTRRWCKSTNRPYDNVTVVEAMPTTFRMNYSEMSPKVYNAFLTANI